MSDSAKIKIELDETVEKNPFFQTIKSIDICRPELFKYAVMMLEVPSHVKDSDFEYLQSKIPALESLYSEFIGFSTERIENLSNDDRVKKIVSEAVGVGLGLKYSVELLGTNPNKFKKIGVARNGKYLDYSTIVDNKEFEIETKGTVSRYYSTFKNDILNKKADSSTKKVYQRFGTIAMLKNIGDNTQSKCVIVDDPPDNSTLEQDDTFNTQLYSYGLLLSFILDSRYYNKYIRYLRKNKIKRIRINAKKFFGKYTFKGKDFYGECFDYRLIKEDLIKSDMYDINLDVLFDKLSKTKNKTKFFIGIDERLIKAINKKEKEFLKEYNCGTQLESGKGFTKFLDKDGILIVKSINGADRQLESIFSEEEVKSRLGNHLSYIQRKPHRCNAPCRSKELRGKPCAIMTYRTNCHFHR